MTLILRKDRDKKFRAEVFKRFNSQCCFLPSIVPLWAVKKNYLPNEMNTRCNRTEDLMIYKKDGKISNNNDDNILIFCKQHYGIVYHELRDMQKKIREQKLGIRKETKQKDMITKEEFNNIISIIPYIHHKIFFFALRFFGSRATETTLLEKRDFTFGDAPTVKFRAENTKRKVERTVPIPTIVVPIFQDYVKKLRDHQRLFEFSPQRAWEIVKDYVKKAGIEKNIHPHSFRHSYATEIYDETEDLKVVQDLLGHKNIATTSIYAHVSKEHRKDVVNKSFQ